MLEVILANEAYILLDDNDEVSNGYRKICNLLVENKLTEPIIAVKDILELKAKVKALLSSAGKGKIILNKKREIPLWRAFIVPANSSLMIKPDKGAAIYLGVKGLYSPKDSNIQLRSGDTVPCKQLNGELDLNNLIASKVPESLLKIYIGLNGNLKERKYILSKILRHISLAREAIMRGAKLIKVNVNGEKYEVLIEEV